MNKQDGEKQKRSIDWEAVEREYRAGMLSIREIAKNHEISDMAIRKKAKLWGWERDLTEKVAEKVRTELVRTEFANSPKTERETVEAAAQVQVQVVKGNRKQIGKAQAVVELLMDQLVDVAGNRSAFEEAAELLCAEDKSDKRLSMIMKAVSLPTHASTVVNLTTALKNLIALERQAFNIADVPGSDGPIEMSDTQRRERLRVLQEKLDGTNER